MDCCSHFVPARANCSFSVTHYGIKKTFYGWDFSLTKIKLNFGKLYLSFFANFIPATRCFTVPMMPSQADFPWVFTKNDPDESRVIVVDKFKENS